MDYLSLDGNGFLAEMYHRYGEVVSPMGCVQGDHSVLLRINEKTTSMTLEELFEYVSETETPIHNEKGDEIYITDNSIKILDSKIGFVGLKRVIRRNPEYNKWMSVSIGDENFSRTLIVTDDHPFITEYRGLVLAKDLTYDDQILIKLEDGSYKLNANVYKIENKPELYQYSYDVTTESGAFEVSGVYSSNCRAFLSPWYERGGMYPADENDKPVFHGRFNIGVVSLNLPMILAKSRQENKDFFEVLDYYLEMIRGIHKRTYDYLGELRASVNPVMFCEGGAYGGHLNPHDKIKPLLKAMTASFGFTALNELEQLYHKKSIREDGSFSLKVIKYINDKLEQYKKEDDILYALYSTPAESLCSLQVTQFRKKYGIIENVSDRTYVSNSFHCHVSEVMDPIEKQDKEVRFWDYTKGGRIQYVKYPINYNKKAIVDLVRRAMEYGLYEGVNLSLAYCNDCGHQELSMDVCPKCGSANLTKIDRMNGYLAFSRVHGDTRLNKGKMDEIADRVSM